jgi:hypothetical protein
VRVRGAVAIASWSRFVQAKLQYSFNHQTGPLQQGPQMVAVQI